MLIHGNEAGVAEMIETEDDSRAASRKRYLYESFNIKRSHKLAIEIRDLYKGVCQLCGFDPLNEYGFHLCHAHHIIWLSRGGEDDVSTLCLISPPHHSALPTAPPTLAFPPLALPS